MSKHKLLFKNLWVIYFIFGCSINQDLFNSSLEENQQNNEFVVFKSGISSEEYLKTLNDFCIKKFKERLPEENKLKTKDWSNRHRSMDEKIGEVENVRYIDNISLFVRLLEKQILNQKEHIQTIKNPGKFLLKKAKEIAAIEDEDKKKEYWGNLEFYLATYAAELILSIKYDDSISQSDKTNICKDIIENFYKSYELIFKKISGIQLEFKKMCEDEKNYNFQLFDNDNFCNLTLVKGVPIMNMEHLGLLMVHPITNEPATIGAICRGAYCTNTKDLNSAESFDKNPFLITFSKSACNYVRSVIDRLGKRLPGCKLCNTVVTKAQESEDFYMKVFREVIDLKMDISIYFDDIAYMDNTSFYFKYNKKYLAYINGQFIMQREPEYFGVYNEKLTELLNINLENLNDTLIDKVNKTPEINILKKDPNAKLDRIKLTKWKVVVFK